MLVTIVNPAILLSAVTFAAAQHYAFFGQYLIVLLGDRMFIHEYEQLAQSHYWYVKVERLGVEPATSQSHDVRHTNHYTATRGI